MITRRQFVTGAATLAALPLSGLVPARASSAMQLAIGEQAVNFTGKARTATTINGSLPAPTLRWREGETVTIDVTNRLTSTSSIHWHGIILPSNMDGVPGLSFDGIAPGGTYRYQFPVRQSGTYWYHSHSGFQEQTGLYGALVIDPAGGDPHGVDRDYTIVLSDWTDESPQRIFNNLRRNSHFYNRNRRKFMQLVREIQAEGLGDTIEARKMWNQMRMLDTDLSDVTGFTYTFLMNGMTPATGWEALFKPHERIRLRFINASAMTIFDVRLPGLPMEVIAADGQDVHPVTVDDFRLGVAETLDVIVKPHHEMPHAIFAQAIDRSGYAIGHLTPKTGLHAEVPAFDPPGALQHVDMGMAHAGMDHADMQHGAMDHEDTGATAMDHSSMNHGQMDHDAMNHGQMNHGEMNHAGMKHEQMDHRAMRRPIPDHPVKHPATEFGPQVDMHAETPRYRLDDPGVGLRHLVAEGRRVLTYADLVRLEPVHARDPDREIELHLTGNMDRYAWSIDGIPYADAEPLHWRFGERVRITFVNDTMMNHPMHLHGMWSELETGSAHLPRKHTVVVQPGAKISYHVQVDARGKWAYHCHMMYHMMGMFREVHVS